MSRGGTRLVADHDGLGAQRRGSLPAGRRRPAHDRGRGLRRARGGQRRARTRDHRRRPQRGVRGQRSRLRRHRPRHHGDGRRHRRRRHVAATHGEAGNVWRRARRHVARRLRRHRRPLAAIDGAVDRWRVARMPRRRPVLDALRQDRGHRRGARGRLGRWASHNDRRRRAPRRDRARPQPAVRRQ